MIARGQRPRAKAAPDNRLTTDSVAELEGEQSQGMSQINKGSRRGCRRVLPIIIMLMRARRNPLTRVSFPDPDVIPFHDLKPSLSQSEGGGGLFPGV